MGNDIRHMDNFTIDLVTSAEVLAVNQDPQCIQGSMVRADGATETWIKPLSDGTFAVLLLNKGVAPANATVYMNNGGQLWGSGVDFFPAIFDEMKVRDLRAGTELGLFSSTFTATVPAHDAMLLRFEPPSSSKSNCSTFAKFLAGNQCQDKDMIGGGGSARDSAEECFKWCQQSGWCRFFSFSTGDGGAAGGGGSSTPWCVRYIACAPRKKHAANYNSYRMVCNETAAGP